MLQRLTRPDESGEAITLAWSGGGHSAQSVARINQCLNGVARVDYMGEAICEGFSVPIKINDTVLRRNEMRHSQLNVTFPPGSPVEGQTIYIIAPHNDMTAARKTVTEMAIGLGEQESGFLRNIAKPDTDENKTVGWMEVASSKILYIFTDEKMFKDFADRIQSKPYAESSQKESRRPARLQKKSERHNRHG